MCVCVCVFKGGLGLKKRGITKDSVKVADIFLFLKIFVSGQQWPFQQVLLKWKHANIKKTNKHII